MNYEINLRSLLLLLAMAQAIIVAALLIRRGLRGDIYLTGLAIALAMSLITYSIGFMGAYDYGREHGFDLTFFPFGNGFLYGPFILLYVMALTDRQFAWKNRYIRWFLPALVYYAIHFGVWGFTPEPEKRNIGDGSFIQAYNIVEGVAFYLFTGWFLYKSIVRIRNYSQLIGQEYSNTAALTLRWLQAFLYAFLGYFIVDLVFEVAGLFTNLGYTGYYWLNLIRAGLLYYISATGLAFGRKTEVEYAVLQQRASAVAFRANESESIKMPLSPEETDTYKTKLLQLFEQEKTWLDPELTLSQLAEKIDLNTTQLSYLINTGLGKNFNDFVNEYRVEAVKQKLIDPAFAHLSLLGIAFECGFNSKATFNRAFKKATGVAPSEYSKSV